MSSLPPMQPDRDENLFVAQDRSYPEPIPTIKETVERLILVQEKIRACLAVVEPLEEEADQMIVKAYHKKHQHLVSSKVAKKLHTHAWKKTKEELSENPEYVAKCKRINALIQEALPLVEEREALKDRLDFGHVREKK